MMSQSEMIDILARCLIPRTGETVQQIGDGVLVIKTDEGAVFTLVLTECEPMSTDRSEWCGGILPSDAV